MLYSIAPWRGRLVAGGISVPSSLCCRWTGQLANTSQQMRGSTARPQDVQGNAGKVARQPAAGPPAGPASPPSTAVDDLRQSLAAVGIPTRDQILSLNVNSGDARQGTASLSNHQRPATVADAAAAALRAEQEPERAGAARTVAAPKETATTTTVTTSTVYLAPVGGPASNYESASSGHSSKAPSSASASLPGVTSSTGTRDTGPGHSTGGKGVTSSVSGATKAAADTGKAAAGAGKAAADSVSSTAKDASYTVTEAGKGAARSITEAGRGAVDAAADMGRGAASTGMSAANTAAEAGKKAASTAVDVGSKAANTAADVGSKAVGSAVDVGSKAASTVTDAGKSAVSTAASMGSKATGTAVDVGSKATSTAVDVGKTAASTAADMGSKAASTAVDAGNKAASTAADMSSKAASTAVDMGSKAASTAVDMGKTAATTAVDMGSKAASTAVNAGKAAANTTVDMGSKAASTAVDVGQKATSTAVDISSKAASTAADAGKGAVKLGMSTAGQAMDASKAAASTAVDLGQTAVGMGMSTANKAMELGKGAANTAADLGKGAVNTAADMSKSAAKTAVDLGKGAASTAVDLGKGTVDTASAAITTAGEVAKGAADTAGEALQRTGSLVEWGQQQANQVGATLYSSTIHPVLSFLWWFYLTLPYEAASWLAANSLALAQQAAGASLSAGHRVASTSSALINRAADIGFHLILGGLRTVNSSMDALVNRTPRLIRDTLAEVASHSRPKRTRTSGSQSSSSDSSEEEEEAIRPDRLEMLEETDVARAANEALHRVFARDEDETVEEGGEASHKRNTLLAEARLLVWHAWMLVALQVTAVRVVLRVTEGMLTWAASAWLQLAKATALLTVIAMAAPVAASAAALAWVCHYGLKQVLSLRVYELRLRRVWAPPLHSVASHINGFLQPYLLPEGDDIKVEGQGEVANKPPGFSIEVEGDAASTSSSSSSEEDVVVDAQKDKGMLFGLLPSFTTMRLGAAQALQQAEDTTAQLVPSQEGQLHEEGEAAMPAFSPGPGGVTQEQLQQAANSSEQAWSKASTLAAATAYTLADAGRVLAQGLSQRFDIELPSWIPGLSSGHVTHAGEEGAVYAFNEAAGKGPTSRNQAIAAVVEEDMEELSMKRHGHAKQLVVFFGAASIGTRGGWGADAVLRACCKVVCRPRGTDQRRGRVIMLDEHRTSRVSSAVNGQQPCESRLSKRRATRPADWKPPAGQAEQRLVHPAWSQQRGQPVRGLMWCPVVAPRKPPQAPRSSQAATQPAASEPGPSTPLPAQRSKRTKAEQAAEPTQPTKGKGKAAKAKPAPQPGRWLDRDCNAALNMQRIGESRWRPLKLCWWPEQGKLPAKGTEYPEHGYKRLLQRKEDMPPLTPRGVAPLHRTVTPVHILGAGSLGLFFAQALRQAGVPVTLHVRSSKAISVLQHGPLLLEQRFKGASELLAVKDVTVELVGSQPPPQQPPQQPAPQQQGSGGHAQLQTKGGAAAAPIHTLVVATKATDLQAAVRALRPRLSHTSTLVLLQNGILAAYQPCSGHALQELWQQQLRRSPWPLPRVVVASVTHGCFLAAPGHVVHAGLGSCTLAELDARLPCLTHTGHAAAMWVLDQGKGQEGGRKAHHQSIQEGVIMSTGYFQLLRSSVPAFQLPLPQPWLLLLLLVPHHRDAQGENQSIQQLLAAPGLQAQLCPSHRDLMRQLHQKLAVNCCINTLTAMLGCRNGQLLDQEHSRVLMQAVCGEAHQLYSQHLGQSVEELHRVVCQHEGGGQVPGLLLREVRMAPGRSSGSPTCAKAKGRCQNREAWHARGTGWLDRDTNGCINFQRIGESLQRPMELCSWKDRWALPPVGKEYQQSYKRVNDRLPKGRQRLHRAAEYRQAAGPSSSNSSPAAAPGAAAVAAHELGLPRIGKGLAETRQLVFNPATQIGVGIDPGVTQAVSAASGVWDPTTGQLLADQLRRWKLTKGQFKHGSGLNNARRDTERWLAPIKPHLQHLAAASSAGTSLEANLKHITVTLATWDAVWEVYLDPKRAEQRLRLYGAQDRTLEQFLKKLEEDMVEVSMKRHGRPRQLVVFFGAASIGTRGGPRGTDQLRGRVVLVDEHRTTRVSSAVNGQQPCERQLNKRRATRPADWKPPAGQVEQRLLRPAWSQRRDQPVRGMMWCPVVAPRKPPQATCSSQEASQPAASEPGPSTPQPAKRSKRTKAEQGKAAKAKPAPQPGRWLDRDCNAALNMQRIGESKWRPLELCYWPEQGKLPAKGKEYPGLGYKRVRKNGLVLKAAMRAKVLQAQVHDPFKLYSVSLSLTSMSLH
ncbi:hypothetical protein QJQ45_027500 [Haematococcus lacustris]|nr:hypothetical protein QJQ45_027500 [Haematococcus lacustris]